MLICTVHWYLLKEAPYQNEKTNYQTVLGEIKFLSEKWMPVGRTMCDDGQLGIRKVTLPTGARITSHHCDILIYWQASRTSHDSRVEEEERNVLFTAQTYIFTIQHIFIQSYMIYTYTSTHT